MTPRTRDFWSGRRVAVIGGTGFLGTHLVAALDRVGADVRIFGLAPPAGHPLFTQARLRPTIGDVRDPSAVARAVSGCSIVFNLAGPVMPGSQGMHDIHTSAIRAILASADRGARIVHTSSILAVGGTTDGQILDEESAFPCLDGSADYLRAKRASEIEALSAGNRDLIVTNPGFLFGPMDYGRSIMGLLCSRFWKGRLFVGTRGGLNVVDVRDVAEGHLRAAEFGRAGRRYILGGANLSMAALMRELADVAQYRPRLLATAPHWLGMSAAALAESRSRLTGRPAMPSFQILRLLRLCWYVRSDRAGVELGYTTRPLSETLADTYRWHHDAGTRPRGINRWLMRPAA